MTRKKIRKPLATAYVENPGDDGITTISVSGGWDPERQTIGLSVKVHRIEPDERSTAHVLTGPDDTDEKEK